MAKGGHSHRSTLKNGHKPFKSKHASKGLLKNTFKGKVEKSDASGPKIRVISKTDRKNSARQLRDTKILDTKLARKLFEGSHGAEKIVTIVALTRDLNPQDIAQSLFGHDDATDKFAPTSVTDVRIDRFKSKVKVIIPDHKSVLSILDAARISDIVIFGVSATEEVEKEYGEQILRALIAQGIASVIGVLPNVASQYPKRNLQQDIRQSLQSFFDHFFPNDGEMFALEVEAECNNCLRKVCQKFPKSVGWRDARGYIVPDNVYWSTQDPGQGSLVVEGTVRGIGFNANGLVHLPGYGDFQIDRLEKVVGRSDVSDEDVYKPDTNQETLDEINPEEVDMEEDEEHFDDEGATLGARMDGKTYFDDEGYTKLSGLRKFKVPHGTSDYQARWLVDDVLEDASDAEEIEQDMLVEDDNDNEQQSIVADDTRSEYATTEFGGESEMHIELSPEEEQRQLEAFRSDEYDPEFPDELELHPEELARKRLTAFRGIKSLGNCTWDHDEEDVEKPSHWNNLLRVGNYKGTRNRVSKDAIQQAQVKIGDRARVFLRAPSTLLQNVDVHTKIFAVYGLLQHEHKLAPCNFSIESWDDYEKPIVERDQIVVQYGPRRVIISPILTQASNNANNVHKTLHAVEQGDYAIATAIAPVMFTNAPVIYFKPNQDPASGDLDVEFVARGTFLNSDYKRIAAQRIVLTGHPIKIHKRVVTVRYMFFNPEDIEWFKAIPLFTKSGRTGFIKESLGTHGYFKATFDGKLTSQDTIAMSMFKRTWPEPSVPYQE